MKREQQTQTKLALRRRPIAIAVSAILAGAPLAHAQDAASPSLETVIVTAQKRSEDLQDVPLSIQALGTTQLEELRIQDFTDYVKFMPSVSFTTIGPGFGVAYMRGVASGENNNHSGPQPTVGMYLDEQPITTITGSLDIHLYDIERVEALAGPQGTLYGASSQAGTIRIITNKPDADRFDAGYAVEGNTIADGGEGYVAEGFVNVPLGERAAIRLVGWYEEAGGFIDTVVRPRTFPTSGGCIINSSEPPPGCESSPLTAKEDQNEVTTYGARAALKIDLNDNWSVTPAVMAQNQEADGSFATDPRVGDYKLVRYYPENSEDEFVQAALTVQGRIGNFDLVYAGAHLKRDAVVNSDYSDYAYFYDVLESYGEYWTDDAGNPLADPSQFIRGVDGYKRYSHELRISSPTDDRLRFVGGLFVQRQEHDIFQNYQIRGLATSLSVTGNPGTIWLTDQERVDRDSAVFGEVSFDLTEKLTLTGGFRHFESKNSLVGFFGFTEGYSGNYGEALCFDPEPFRSAPCTNLDDEVEENGTIPRFNITYRIDPDRMVYATFSRGFRPGGINRNGTVPPYKPDYLDNYEVGWKTTWAGNRLRFNGAAFLEEWDDIQFSFLPPSGAGLTVIRNAGAARIRGIEMDAMWAATDALVISGGVSFIDAELAEDYVPDPDAAPAASKGTQLPVTPDFKANLTARYTVPIGDSDIYVQGSGVYQTESWSDLLQSDREILGDQDAYGIVDLSAGWERNEYTLELFINNAFDEHAELFKFAQCTTGVCGGNPYVVRNMPRTIGVRFSQDF